MNKPSFLLKIPTIVILFIFIQNIYSQEVETDSFSVKNSADVVFRDLIKKIRVEKSDTSKINLYNEVAWNYAPTNFEKCISYCDSAITLSKKNEWFKGEAYALKNYGEALRYNGKVEESLAKFKSALVLFEKLKYENEVASLQANIGISYYKLSNFSKSTDYYSKALNTFEKTKNEIGLLKIYTYYGILYYAFKDYNQSLMYYENALKLAKKLRIETSIASIIGNIGIVYNDQNKLNKALKNFKSALQIFKKLKDINNYSIFLGNISNLYTIQKEYSKALVYGENALKYSKKVGDNFVIAVQYDNLGKIQFSLAKQSSNININKKDLLLQSSIKNFLSAIENFEQLGNIKEKFETLINLSKVYKELNQYKLSVEMFEDAIRIKDSLYSFEVNKAIANMEYKQDIQLKEKEIQILNSEKQYQSLVKEILIGLAIILILTLIAIYYLYYSKKKHNKILTDNIVIRKKIEEELRENELNLKKHKEELEITVDNRTIDLQKEIKERKNTEVDLRIAIDRAESANRAKTVFLENMSHELRTPLVGILGYSDLLAQECDDSDLKEMAYGINRTGNRLLNTVSMVLDLARIESDKFEIDLATVNVYDELTEIYNNFKGAVSSKNIDFQLSLTNEVRAIETDKGMFKVVVENLVNNAIKFTKDGEIIIESKELVENEKKYFLINISDTGIGIREEDITTIFDKFKQLSEGTLKDFPGSGLGLSISKKYTKFLSGELSVTSEFNSGSTFTLKFPLNKN